MYLTTYIEGMTARADVDVDEAAVHLRQEDGAASISLRGDPADLRRLLTEAIEDLDRKTVPALDPDSQEGVGRVADVTRPGFRAGGVMIAEPGKPTYHEVIEARHCGPAAWEGRRDDCLVVMVAYGGSNRTLHLHPDEEVRWITVDRAKDLTAEAIEHEANR